MYLFPEIFENKKLIERASERLMEINYQLEVVIDYLAFSYGCSPSNPVSLIVESIGGFGNGAKIYDFFMELEEIVEKDNLMILNFEKSPLNNSYIDKTECPHGVEISFVETEKWFKDKEKILSVIDVLDSLPSCFKFWNTAIEWRYNKSVFKNAL